MTGPVVEADRTGGAKGVLNDSRRGVPAPLVDGERHCAIGGDGALDLDHRCLPGGAGVGDRVVVVAGRANLQAQMRDLPWLDPRTGGGVRGVQRVRDVALASPGAPALAGQQALVEVGAGRALLVHPDFQRAVVGVVAGTGVGSDCPCRLHAVLHGSAAWVAHPRLDGQGEVGTASGSRHSRREGR